MMSTKYPIDKLKNNSPIELKIEKDDDIVKLFNKIMEVAKYSNFLENKFTISYNFLINETKDENLKKTYEILISSFESKKPFLDIIDDLLFFVLYTKEKFLLGHKKKLQKIKKLDETLLKFSNYRDEIADNELRKNLKNDDDFIFNPYGGVDRLIVLLTHSCQLRCEYCRVRKFRSEISETVLFKSIDLLFTSVKKNIQLQFFGGEPLLKFDLIKKAVEYAEMKEKRHEKNLEFILTTNGIALTQEKISYFKKHKFLIEFSFDGGIDGQLKTRRPAHGTNYYSIIENNLKNLLTSGIPYYTITVITPETVRNLYKNFIYLVNGGYRRLQINYSLGFYWDTNATKELLRQFIKIMSFIKKKNHGIELMNLTEMRREPVVLNAELSVDCDGTIYLESGICLEKDFRKMKNKFKISDIETAKNINLYATTRFTNFYRLVKVYSENCPKFRMIILNNIELGNFLNKFLKKNFKEFRINWRKNEK